MDTRLIITACIFAAITGLTLMSGIVGIAIGDPFKAIIGLGMGIVCGGVTYYIYEILKNDDLL